MEATASSNPSAVTTERSGSDLLRQILVICAFCFMIVAALVGTGFFGGTSVQNLQQGSLDTDASYLAPASPAFSIWSVIYLGLFGYTVWQALPSQRATHRARSLGWWIALTMVLNGCWLVAAQFGTLPLTVVVIVLLLIALCLTFRVAVLTRLPDDRFADAVLIDGVTGLHLGWVTIATVANTAAWLTDIAPAEWGAQATAWGIGVLVVVAVIGVGTAWGSGWRIAPALALGWGLGWLGVARLIGDPQNAAIGITAIVVAVIVVLPPVVIAGLRMLRPESD